MTFAKVRFVEVGPYKLSIEVGFKVLVGRSCQLLSYWYVCT